MPLAPGDRFAGYTVVRQLGSGGMGSVYLVRHPRLPRSDVLKLLHPELSSEPEFTRRFLREAETAAGLAHRAIVPVLDRGNEDGRLWLTMPYIQGVDAEGALADAGGLFPPERAVHLITEVAAALDYAHRRKLVHRDVKPANILLQPTEDDDGEQVFLSDFGIAKLLDRDTRLTRTGAVMATFDYASPEQIESRPLDARSDIYSLGCVLYRFVAGSVPYPGHTIAAAMHGHLTLPPPAPSQRVPWLSPALDDVISRAMAKNPDERFSTCRELAEAFAEAIDQFPDPPPAPYRISVTRPQDGGGEIRAEIHTDELRRRDAIRLADLVRRTRLFDLPESLLARGGPELESAMPVLVDIRIASAERSVAVRADLASAYRPPGLDELVSTVERGVPAGQDHPSSDVPHTNSHRSDGHLTEAPEIDSSPGIDAVGATVVGSAPPWISERHRILGASPLFGRMRGDHVQALASAGHIRRYRRGEVVFRIGDPGDSVLVISEGSVKTVSQTQDEELLLAVMGAGETIGELVVADGSPRSATAIALDNVTLLELPRHAVLAAADRSPELTHALLSLLAGTVRRLTGDATDIVFLDVPRRAAKLLLSLPRTAETGRIAPDLSQQELADMIGAPRRSFEAALQSFERSGWIALDQGRIVVQEPAALRRFVE